MTPNPYSEDQLVEQPAIALFGSAMAAYVQGVPWLTR